MTWITAIFYFFIFRILLQYPYILLALVLAYFLRDRIPSPAEFFRRQKAFKRLQFQVGINPHDSTARRDLGLVLLDKKRPADALGNFMEALKKEPDSPELNHYVGLSLLRTGKAAEAVPYLEKAIKIEPRLKYGESYLYLGEALLELNRNAEALEALKTFLGINHTSIEGLYQYARALKANG
ncbi:MAG TPA: tetratricopeptide repeat protein, partial [Nitrospirota bacterium]